MAPPSWSKCPHCNSQFGSASLAKHEAKCKMRADIRAEHEALLELRKIEGPRPKAIPDWPLCENCGQPYGPHAIGPHTKRCKKLLPHGANGYGPQDHHKDPKFQHLYKASNIGVEDRANEGMADALQQGLSGLGKSMSGLLALLGPKMTQEELDWLRRLFDRFDANKDERLDMDEFSVLLRNVFPARVADSQSVVSEFQKADVDGSGTIDFPEFAKMYVDMRDNDVDPRFDEACRMFDFFDADKSGELDPDEFLCLLNQVFPEYCEENEARAVEQFAEADSDGSGGISFPEFIAYYDLLKRLYDGYERPQPPSGPTPEEIAAEMAAEEARRRAEIEASLVECKCGLTFLPSVLPQHQRSCEACKPVKKEVKFDEEAPRSSVEFGENDANGFVACEWCARTFFPDRLAVHHRVCKQKLAADAKKGGGIRATITDGKQVTVGLYRSMKSGKWTKSGRMEVGARPEGAARDHNLYHSPAKAASVLSKEDDKKAKVDEANRKEAAKE